MQPVPEMRTTPWRRPRVPAARAMMASPNTRRRGGTVVDDEDDDVSTTARYSCRIHFSNFCLSCAVSTQAIPRHMCVIIDLEIFDSDDDASSNTPSSTPNRFFFASASPTLFQF